MPTTVTSSIGSGGGRDYSTIQAWEDACPTDLRAGTGVDQIWKGECYADSTFANTTFGGISTDTDHYVWLTAAAGQSFADQPRTTALNYGMTGVKVESGSYVITIANGSGINLTVERLQIKNEAYFFASGFPTFRNCLIRAQRMSAGAKFYNCLVIGTNTSGDWSGGSGIDGSVWEGCTVINNSGGATVGGIAFFGTVTVENCAIFGWSTGFSAGDNGTLAGGHNCTDLASAPGSNNQLSKTFSAQFESTTTDFRAKSGSDLENNGTPSSDIPTDITGTTRSATTPTIGAWELVAAGGPTPITASDTASLSAAESVALLALLAGTDTASVSGNGVAALLSTLARTDTASLSATGSTALLALITRTDMASLSASEARALLALLARGDSASLSASDVAAVIAMVLKSASDSAGIAVTESASVQTGLVAKAASDAASLSASEAVTVIVLTLKSALDTATVTVTEAKTLLSTLARTDTVALTATETAALMAFLARVDVGSLSATELAQTLIRLSRVDVATLSATDVATLRTLSNQLAILRTGVVSLNPIRTVASLTPRRTVVAM